MIYVKRDTDSIPVTPNMGETEQQCVTRLRGIWGHSGVTWDDEAITPMEVEVQASPAEAPKDEAPAA